MIKFKNIKENLYNFLKINFRNIFSDCKNLDNCLNLLFLDTNIFSSVLESEDVMIEYKDILINYIKANKINGRNLSEFCTKASLTKEAISQLYKKQAYFELKNYFKNEATNKFMTEITPYLYGYFFEDYVSNVGANIRLILKRAKLNQDYKNKIDKDFYQLINDCYNLEQTYNDIEFRNKGTRSDYYFYAKQLLAHFFDLEKRGVSFTNLLYDAVSNARNDFGIELSNSVKNTSEMILNSKSREVNGIKIYELIGQPFNLLIHCCTLDKNPNTFNNSLNIANEIYDNFSKSKKNYIYFSYWCDTHTKSIIDSSAILNAPILGFTNIQANRLISATPFNGSSDFMDKSVRNSAGRYVSTFSSFSDFALQSGMEENNEIKYLTKTIAQDEKPLLPTFVISLSNNPNKLSVELAKKFNVPILFVDRTKYKNHEASPAKVEYQTSPYYNMEI